ncbi:MAG: exopolysaccharide Pel transporter PelG [Bilifractor sp.]
MAGIGIRLNRIFEKRSVFADIFGVFYSSIVTVAPMFLVIGVIILMQWALGYAKVGYAQRELFADTILYIFIFSLLAAAPFNAVLSRYLSDTIYNERYQDIMPCFYVGLLLNLILGSVMVIPFCLHEYFVGKVALYYVCTSYLGYIALLLVFYSMLYLSITKDYAKLSLFFAIGMAAAFGIAWAGNRLAGWDLPYAILFALTAGFLLTASLEIALIQSYFRENSGVYKSILRYFREYWQLILINFLYTLGLFIQNFVFWTTEDHLILVKSFFTHMSYDMATCLAMFTNISATVIFISRVEMFFHDRYRAYTEAVIGGRGTDIENAKHRVFRQLSTEIMSLARIQFIITVIVFLFCMIVLPTLGFAGETMQIYPLLCVGYYIMFLMYALLLFLYYFNDLTGALWSAGMFCLGTFLGSIFATFLTPIWYGTGLVIGATVGWVIGFFRLRWLEQNMDAHVFCVGHLMQHRREPMPSGMVFNRRDDEKGDR